MGYLWLNNNRWIGKRNMVVSGSFRCLLDLVRLLKLVNRCQIGASEMNICG